MENNNENVHKDDVISDELEQLRFNRLNDHRMFNSITGEHIDVKIFTGPSPSSDVENNRVIKYDSHINSDGYFINKEKEWRCEEEKKPTVGKPKKSRFSYPSEW